MAKKRLILLSLALVASAFLAGQAGKSGSRFADRANEFVLENLQEFVSEGLPGQPQKFRATGAPLRGFSKKQGIRFVAKQVDGIAAPAGKGALQLKEATATGDVVLERGLTEGAAKANYVLRTQKLLFRDDGAEATATLPVALTLESDSSGEGATRNWTIQGTSGVVKMASQAKSAADPLKSAEIAGPVVMKLVSTTRQEVEGKTSTVKTIVDGKGDRLLYDATTRTLVVVGNVDYKGTRSVDGGAPDEYESQVDRMTVVFDQKYEIVNVRLEGSPGRATMKEAPKTP